VANEHGYHPFHEGLYAKEAAVIQQRINNRKNNGISVATDQVWVWIKERHPTWTELDWEKVFQKVKL